MSLPYKPLTLGFKVKHLKPHRWLSTPVPNSSAILSCLDPAPHLNTSELQFAPGVFAQVSPPTGMPALPSCHRSDASHLGLPLQTQLLTPNPMCKPGSAHPGPTPRWLWAVSIPMWFLPHPVPPLESPSPESSKLWDFQFLTPHLPQSFHPVVGRWLFLSLEKAAGCRGHLPSLWDTGEGWLGWGFPRMASQPQPCF